MDIGKPAMDCFLNQVDSIGSSLAGYPSVIIRFIAFHGIFIEKSGGWTQLVINTTEEVFQKSDLIGNDIFSDED